MWQVFIQWPTRWIEELEVAFVFNIVSLLAFYGWLVVLPGGALWFAPMNQVAVCFSYFASSMCPDLLVAQLATFEIDKLCTRRFVSAVMKIMLWMF